MLNVSVGQIIHHCEAGVLAKVAASRTGNVLISSSNQSRLHRGHFEHVFSQAVVCSGVFLRTAEWNEVRRSVRLNTIVHITVSSLNIKYAECLFTERKKMVNFCF